jgi:AcrR family transcriptional regulator
MRTTTTRHEPLRREAIVVAAVAIADESGVERLTMRDLAKRLGYKVMSLYNHVANKDELLALMVDRVAAEVEQPPPDLEPLQAARAIAVSIRAVFVRHPWAPSLWHRHLPGPSQTMLMERLLHTLNTSGLSPGLAHHGYHAVTNHVLGYSLQELGMSRGLAADGDPAEVTERFLAGLSPQKHPETRAHVQQHLAGDTASSFELVLDLILDGLARIETEAAVPD